MAKDNSASGDVAFPEVDGTDSSYHAWVDSFSVLNPKWKRNMDGYQDATDKLRSRAQQQSPTQTPPPKMLPVPEHTPEQVPRPYSKMALMASKRAEQEMKKVDSNKKNKSVEQKTAKGQTKKTNKGQATGSKPQAKRDLSTGPIYTAFQAYVNKQKAKGIPHMEALKNWKSSLEREALLRDMPEAELKRRRFSA